MALPPVRNEVVETTIAGTVYKIEKLGAKKGKAIMMTLLRVVGPALEGENKIAKFCELATDAQLDNLCDTFAAVTRISPEANPEVELALKDVFDKHFAGHYGTMILWLKACLDGNFGSFLGELGVDASDLMGMLSTLMKPESAATPTVPTAPSGASSLRASEA